MIDASVEQVSWNKGRCRKLSTKAMTLVLIICDYYDNQRADPSELQSAVEQTIQVMAKIGISAQSWAELSFWESWYQRHEIDTRIQKHEDNLKQLTEYLSLASSLHIHDQVIVLQESLKNNPRTDADRKRAEEQLYRLRSAGPGKLADLTPPELACECVRLGSQPEYSGITKDIWKGRWLGKQDVALISYKEYKMGAENPDAVQIFDIIRGLHYLHGQNVIHGSLKPSNILIQDDGRAVLSGFSLARPGTQDPKNTQTDLQADIYRYRAPEVILDDSRSKASDVYSWAMTALEIITGDPPFHNHESLGQPFEQAIRENQIPNRSDYKSPVLDKHPDIWALFVRCWSRKPADRPTTEEIDKRIRRVSDTLLQGGTKVLTEAPGKAPRDRAS
ncbi:hypothetical protein FRC01_003305 [Tulasnella sp. 417]|nr:hypothetical protein FRC01_003305 [Tulasnella sp. 417]